MALQTFTAGQVLTADQMTTLQANNGLQLISRVAISGSSSQAFDNVFTSTYENYLVLVQQCYGSVAGGRLRFQFRYAGPTTQAASYYGSFIYGNPITSAFGCLPVDNNGASLGLCIWNTSDSTGSASITVQGVAVAATAKPQVMGSVAEGYSAWTTSGGGIQNVARNYTGFILTPSSGTFTANVSVYGYGKA